MRHGACRRRATVQSNILLIDDDSSLSDLVGHELGSRGHKVLTARSAEDGLGVLKSERVDVVLTDVSLGGMTGVAFCGHARTLAPDLPVVVMTAYGTMDAAIGAIRAGAYDFVTKPFEIDHVALVIDRAVGLHALRAEVARLRSTTAETSAKVAPRVL